jgi:hypothetical protein
MIQAVFDFTKPPSTPSTLQTGETWYNSVADDEMQGVPAVEPTKPNIMATRE